MQQLPFPLYIVAGPEFRVVLVNNKLLQIWELPEGAVLNRPVLELSQEQNKERLHTMLQHVYETGEKQVLPELPVQYTSKGLPVQEIHQVELSAYYGQDGQIQGVIAVGYDITTQVKARKEAAASENFMRTVLESSPDCVKILDLEGRLNYMNYNGICQMEIDDFQLVEHKYWWELWPERSRTVVQNALRDAQAGKIGRFQAFCPTAKGSPRWWDVQVAPVVQNDSVGQLVSVSRNITQEKAAEATIMASEQRFRNTFDNAAVGISHVSLEGELLLLNDRFCDIVGYSEAELRTLRFQDITHPEDLQKDLLLVEALRSGDIPHYNLEKRYLHKNGSEVWVNLTVGLVRTAEGAPHYFISVIEDISQRKQAEEKIAESEQRYRALSESLEQQVAQRTLELQQSQLFLKAILDTTQNGIVSYKPMRNDEGNITDFRIIFANDQVFRDFSIHKGNMLDKTMKEVLPFAFTDGTFEKLLQVVETGTGTIFEMEVPMVEQSLFFEIKAVPMDGGVTLTATNITEVKRAALELSTLNSELQRSNTDLQQFAHVASHDLKEPVRKIRTFTSRLQLELNNQISESAKTYLDKIMSASSRMIKMIDGVLEYSTINATQQPFEPVNLWDVLRQIEHDLEIALIQKSAEMHYEHLPTVKGAPFLLYQLFYNLVNNSLKFARENVAPQINITAQTAQKDEGLFIKIEVRDNGIGFDQEHAAAIFKTFTRLHSKDRFEGTGLGLALCQKIVERHHGTIAAEGRPGEGASFIIELPL